MKPGTFNPLELARQAMAGRASCFPDDKMTILNSPSLRVYLSRFRELLLMTAVNGDPTKAVRVRIGYFSVYSGWVVDLDAAAYQRWAARAMRLAHTPHEEDT
jgi:hypothetical protein